MSGASRSARRPAGGTSLIAGSPSFPEAGQVDFCSPYYAKFKRRRKKQPEPARRKGIAKPRWDRRKKLLTLLPLLLFINILAFQRMFSGRASTPSLTDEDFASILEVDSVRRAGKTVYLRSVREWDVDEEKEELETILGRLTVKAMEKGYSIVVLCNPGGEVIGISKKGSTRLQKPAGNT